jgi:heme-degrading monooxygenase HmoA
VLIKWVRCRVTDREAFTRGQEGWKALAEVPGFLGQCGGWSRTRAGVAHVFAWWRSEDDHAAFLAGPHDGLAAGQAGSYGEIGVRLFERELIIGAGPGVGNVVRLAHCDVLAGREEHFVRAQSEVWNPGMEDAPGMLGGLFGRREREFLVLTWWSSEQDHDRYQRERFPRLRKASGAADDLAAINGDLVVLEPTWTVLP